MFSTISQEQITTLYKQEPAVFSQIGQITLNTQAGKELVKNLIAYKPKTILEIGTWNGMGTTRCILYALNEYDFHEFISIECNPVKHQLAIQNNSEFIRGKEDKIKLLNATILEENDWQEAKELFKNEMNQEWFDGDYANSKSLENIFSKLNNIDAIVLDGGEYSTYHEYKKLLPLCKSLIFLDDTNTCKCRKIVEELTENKDWKLIFHTNERNGFAIFKKI